MDEEQEDVRKMSDFLKSQTSSQTCYQLEFEDFVSYRHEDSDQEFDDDIVMEDIEPSSSKPIPSRALSFTEDEQTIIDSCSDLELKRLLILNRSKNLQLMKLHKKIQTFVKQTDNEIAEKRLQLKTAESRQITQHTYLWKLMAPYFKDKQLYPSPLNADAHRKRSNNELTTYDLIPSRPWNLIEFNNLTNAVKCNYNINRQNEIVARIASLKLKLQEEEHLHEEILALKKKLEEIKSDEDVPPLNSNEFINWYKIEETFLKRKHTALECQSVWHAMVHPLINKSDWSEEENTRLVSIAKKFSFQNWEQIASELNTNRTAFTTCLHYFSKLCDKFKKSKFTADEDDKLLEAVELYKTGSFIPWNKVVCHFNNRSRHQLYHRYTYFLSTNYVKRGKFSEAEDILLVILVNKFGKNFRMCAQYMPYRSQLQLKSRYNSNLQRQNRKGTFTVEDDKIIYEFGQKNGEKNWSALRSKLHRGTAQIRQRYNTIKKFLEENPNSSITDIPKRKHRYDKNSEGQHNFINYLAEEYGKSGIIPTLEMIEENLETKLSSFEEKPVRNIDDLLTDFFGAVQAPSSTITERTLQEASENCEELLYLLGAQLELPESFDCDHLDNIDVEILERLAQKGGLKEGRIERLVPPNLGTLIGLKNLILEHKSCKAQLKKQGRCETGSDSVEEVSKHEELFSRRFGVLFDWSAILSLEKPIQAEINPVSTSRPSVTIKKQKLSATHSRLISKEVGGSVFRKNQVGVGRLGSIGGATGMVLKSCKNKNGTVSEEVTEEDLHDVENLDVMLKSMKSERNDSDCKMQSESVDDDVKLLQEALNFETHYLKFETDNF